MPSMRDVADAAGVSTATVSRVLSGAGDGVRPETAELVRQAAGRLEYRYNGVAAALRRRRTMLIGVCVPRIANPFFAQLVEALEHAFAPSGFDLLLGDARDDPKTEQQRIESLLDRQVDAMVIIPTDSARSARTLERALVVPVVQLDRRIGGIAVDSVGIDQASAMADVVKHLRQRGHEDLVYIGAEPMNTSSHGRLDGVRRSAPGTPELLGDFTMEWGEQAMLTLLGGELRPTAVVCANDLIAYGVLAACRRRRLSVPDDVAVTGFDDLQYSTLVDPPLTTVRQPIRHLAAAAARQLLLRLKEPDADGAATDIQLRAQVIVRAST